MARIEGKFNDVDAWNGIPGIEINEATARTLIDNGVPVRVYNKTVEKPPKKNREPWTTRWNLPKPPGMHVPPLPPGGGLRVGPQPPAAKPMAEVTRGYNLATPLARCLPDVDVIIWLCKTFDPIELHALYHLQEGGTWRVYARQLYDEAQADVDVKRGPIHVGDNQLAEAQDTWEEFFK